MADDEEKVVSEPEEKKTDEENKDESAPNVNEDGTEETSKPELSTDAKEETIEPELITTIPAKPTKGKLPDENTEARSVVQPLLTGRTIKLF